MTINAIKPDCMVGYDMDGTETRRQVIGAALEDARQWITGINVLNLGDVVEQYLVYWEDKQANAVRVDDPTGVRYTTAEERANPVHFRTGE